MGNKYTDRLDEANGVATKKLGELGATQDMITMLQVAALVRLLLDKGVMTEEEWGSKTLSVLEGAARDIEQAKARAELHQRLLS